MSCMYFFLSLPNLCLLEASLPEESENWRLNSSVISQSSAPGFPRQGRAEQSSVSPTCLPLPVGLSTQATRAPVGLGGSVGVLSCWLWPQEALSQLHPTSLISAPAGPWQRSEITVRAMTVALLYCPHLPLKVAETLSYFQPYFH